MVRRQRLNSDVPERTTSPPPSAAPRVVRLPPWANAVGATAAGGGGGDASNLLAAAAAKLSLSEPSGKERPSHRQWGGWSSPTTPVRSRRSSFVDLDVAVDLDVVVGEAKDVDTESPASSVPVSPVSARKSGAGTKELQGSGRDVLYEVQHGDPWKRSVRGPKLVKLKSGDELTERCAQRRAAAAASGIGSGMKKSASSPSLSETKRPGSRRAALGNLLSRSEALAVCNERNL